MYVATIPNRNSPPAILLREGYREAGTAKNRTLANITSWPLERIEALKRALKGDFDHMGSVEDPVSDRIFAVLFVLMEIAKRLGIVRALGRDRMAKLALFVVLARVAHQGSRLSAVRWASDHAVAEILGLEAFDEDHLYAALDWLAENQEKIEQKLYRAYVKLKGESPSLVLYDVTSSYFEGQCNEMADFGHNRDGKRGKKQIVIGLLTAACGEPLAVRVFRGNTSDPTTVADQVEILKKQFSVSEVVFVGDRGMVKSTGKKALSGSDLKYITALTDPQIRKLLKKDVVQMGLFDEKACEVDHGTLRLVLRRNPAVARKEALRREDKIKKLSRLLEERNEFVENSLRAKPETGLNKFARWTRHHKLTSFVEIRLEARRIVMEIDADGKEQDALLDGCYVLETDVTADKMDAVTVDERYRDLQKVERDFRNMKTALLEIRPIFVRKKSRTIGHVFSAVLALKISREMENGLKAAFGTTEQSKDALTIKDALNALARLCFERYEIGGREFLRLPRPDAKQLAIFEAVGVTPPRSTNRKPA